MLSVVIPTRNRARLLSLAIGSIEAQTLPRSQFEVLVVDNGSSDGTRELVQDAQRRLDNLRYLFAVTPGLHVGRHVGLRQARGEVLVYADDDIEAAPTWLEALQECFGDPHVAMAGGNNSPKFEAAPPEWLRELWCKPAYGGQAIPYLSVLQLPAGRRAISPFCVWGCNFSIRKQVLLAAGGFHPDGMPEERIRFRGDGETHVSAYVERSGLLCMFDSRASVQHAVTNERMTFDYFRKRAFSQGISDSYTALRGRNAAAPLAVRALGLARRAVRNLRGRAAALTQAPQLRRLDRCIAEGYRAGYRFHQAAYQQDPEVRAWVHQPDYFQAEGGEDT